MFFEHNSTEHQLIINSLNNNTVTFTVQSEPQTFVLAENEDVDVDLTEDDVVDINVEVTDISNQEATFKITQIEVLNETVEEPSPVREQINRITGAVAGAVEEEPEISFGFITILILIGIGLITAAYYGGLPIPKKSHFDRATYFHRKAELEYRKGNHKKSAALHKKAQLLREKGERRTRR